MGSDVANAPVDIALCPTGERWSVPHDDTGVAALVPRLACLPRTCVVLEATGGFQRAVVAARAAAVHPPPRPLPDAPTDARRALLTRRRQLGARRTAERNRLGSAPRRVQADLQAHIAWLDQRLAALDDDLDTAPRAMSEMLGSST